MARPPLTVTIVACNEEKHIGQAVESAAWADEVLVIDSGSTDRTVELAKAAGARVEVNPWPGYGQQKNFAQKAASHDWVLNIDADEVISSALRQEIESRLTARSSERGFELPRKTFFCSQWIKRGGWYPNFLVRLVDRRHARWSEPPVHEALQVDGPLGRLNEDLLHYSFESVQDQVLTNARFSRLGTQELIRRGARPSLLTLTFKPWWKFVDAYFLKLGFLDGIAGFVIAVNAAHSMFMKYAGLWFQNGGINEAADRR